MVVQVLLRNKDDGTPLFTYEDRVNRVKLFICKGSSVALFLN